MRKPILLAPFIVFQAALVPVAFEQPPQPRWYKGNTHAHTLESDGDSPPEVVTAWYRDHGYNFLVITDHNILIGSK